ncbi:MAG: hypothetical protein HY556_04225 [Euryarchaeota archaeon]|nr:hypothetical protein [Euryarchaeota archaeon]
MTGTPEQVAAKIKKTFCSEKQAAENPILEYHRHIIFERFPSVKIERPAKFGGDLEFKSYTELEAAFVEGKLHPADAKAGAAKHINLLLDPVRRHFEKNETAWIRDARPLRLGETPVSPSAARELKAQVESFKVTR